MNGSLSDPSIRYNRKSFAARPFPRPAFPRARLGPSTKVGRTSGLPVRASSGCLSVTASETGGIATVRPEVCPTICAVPLSSNPVGIHLLETSQPPSDPCACRCRAAAGSVARAAIPPTSQAAAALAARLSRPLRRSESSSTSACSQYSRSRPVGCPAAFQSRRSRRATSSRGIST